MLLQMAKQTLCEPGTKDPTRLSQTCLWVFECLLQRYRSAVACHRDWGSGCSRPEQRRGIWHLSSWRRSLLSHHRATEQMTHKLGNNYTKKFFHCWESCRASNGFPNLGIWQRNWEPPREFDFEIQWDMIIELHRTGEAEMEGTKKILGTLWPRRKEQWPQKRLSQACLGVFRSLCPKCG